MKNMTAIAGIYKRTVADEIVRHLATAEIYVQSFSKSLRYIFMIPGRCRCSGSRDCGRRSSEMFLKPLFFSELIKKHGRDSVYYWRTKDGKEIDFILSGKNDLLPVEAKLNFGQFNPSSIKYFTGKYGLKKYSVIGINGNPKTGFSKYPWDI